LTGCYAHTHSTDDWDIGLPGGPTLPAIQTNFQRWLAGPKTPGLIVLEHELTDNTVQAFLNAYPLFAQNGWETVSIADMFPEDGGAYQDGDPAFGTVSANNAAGSPTIPGVSGAPTSTAPVNGTTGGGATETGSSDAAQSSSAALGLGSVTTGGTMWQAVLAVVMAGAAALGLFVPFV
jgi:hypothetical protein